MAICGFHLSDFTRVAGNILNLEFVELAIFYGFYHGKSPKIGEMIQFDEYFSKGWLFNHHVVKVQGCFFQHHGFRWFFFFCWMLNLPCQWKSNCWWVVPFQSQSLLPMAKKKATFGLKSNLPIFFFWVQERNLSFWWLVGKTLWGFVVLHHKNR